MIAKNRIITCLLLEDDTGTRQMMVDVITRRFAEMQTHPCATLAEANKVLTAFHPDILVLDAHLPDGNSFEWLSTFYTRASHCKIIFVTAYSDFAVSAFQFNALDFLLKPFTPRELLAAMEKAIASLEDEAYKLQLETLIQNMGQPNHGDKKIVLKTVDDIHVIQLKEVLQAKAEDNYTSFHLVNGTELLVSQPLKSFEKKLAKMGFMRVHQSHLVNLMHILTFRKRNATLVLTNQLVIPVAQRKKSDVVAYLSALS